MVRSSGQHKCALIFCGTLLIVLGGGIAGSGFVYDFVEPYSKVDRKEPIQPFFRYFTHIQYWLGIPLVLLGIFVLTTAFCAVKCLIVFGFLFSSLLLVTSILGVVLEGPAWRDWLEITTDDSNCDDSDAKLNITCNEIRYATVLSSIIVTFSTSSILVCQFCCFVYLRILGWMSHVKYDNPIDDYYSKAMGSRFAANGHSGRANQVMLNSMS